MLARRLSRVFFESKICMNITNWRPGRSYARSGLVLSLLLMTSLGNAQSDDDRDDRNADQNKTKIYARILELEEHYQDVHDECQGHVDEHNSLVDEYNSAESREEQDGLMGDIEAEQDLIDECKERLDEIAAEHGELKRQYRAND